jgi:hypothetical protein
MAKYAKNTRITPSDTIAIAELLKSVLEKTEDGLRYTDGWSDSKVADKLGATVPQVMRIRVDVFGRLTAGNPAFVQYGKIAKERFERLEAAFEELSKRFDELSRKVGGGNSGAPATTLPFGRTN